MYSIRYAIPEFLYGKLRNFLQQHSVPKWLVFTQDMLAVYTGFIFAYLLRFNLVPGDFSMIASIYQGGVSLAAYGAFSLAFRSHTGLIRHTTIVDIMVVLMATTSAATSLLVLSLVGRVTGLPPVFLIPVSIILIHYMGISLFLSVVRIMIKSVFMLVTMTHLKKKRILVYGAGAMGVIVKRVVYSDIKSTYQVAGFLDDSRNLQGKKLNGISVFSPRCLEKDFVEKQQISALIFAVEKFPLEKKKQYIRKALNLGLEILETPAPETWFNGQFQMHQLRKIDLNDLLGREPIKLNLTRIGMGLAGKTILVTGAAGSIGSEIVRQLSRFNCRRLILIDQAETPMFHLTNELHTHYPTLSVHLLVADVTHAIKMDLIFQTWKPDVVFHAAAYKHVPLMEENPHEAIRVNVGSTRILSRLSVKYGVVKFVLISTDKAVNPANIMGASKRICELIIQSKAKSPGVKTQFVTTRFGNVLGSNGSVIPLFAKQIETGGPVTVTHPEITRYFMTIPEACQLVLEAGFMGKGGEIFVFDMGKPVKIDDLARQMIRLSGLVPGQDIAIEYTGLRPGEKLFEELLADKETHQPTHHPKIKIANCRETDPKTLLGDVEGFLANLYLMNRLEVVKKCMELVPEYQATTTSLPHEDHLNDSGEEQGVNNPSWQH